LQNGRRVCRWEMWSKGLQVFEKDSGLSRNNVKEAQRRGRGTRKVGCWNWHNPTTNRSTNSIWYKRLNHSTHLSDHCGTTGLLSLALLVSGCRTQPRAMYMHACTEQLKHTLLCVTSNLQAAHAFILHPIPKPPTTHPPI